MDKLNFKKEYKEFYNASAKEIQVVNVPEFSVLSSDGYGDPGGPGLFAGIAEKLFSLSYTIKFALKKNGIGIEYSVPPLEGLWWMENNNTWDINNKEDWKWTLMIAQPSFVKVKDVDAAKEQMLKKKELDTSAVRFEKFKEGLSVQLMHIGPYSAETSNIQKMHKFMEDNGYTFNGKHHEIYLGDPHKSAPEKLKTILRQPVKKK